MQSARLYATRMLKDNRKLIALVVSVLAILLLALWGSSLQLTEKGLDTAVYGIVGCLGLYCGGNVGEHWSKRGQAAPVA